MSATDSILAQLRKRGGTATNREIANDLSLPAHRVAGMLSVLRQRGKVVRLVKGHAGRASVYRLNTEVRQSPTENR